MAAREWAAMAAADRGGGLQVLLPRPVPIRQRVALREHVERSDRLGLAFLQRTQAARAERLVLTGRTIPGDSSRVVTRGPLLPGGERVSSGSPGRGHEGGTG